MNQGKRNEIIELEKKFQQLVDNGHPNVVDNGFFIDAVFNVTSVLKKMDSEEASSAEDKNLQMDQGLKVISNLYQSLKDFESLYNNCLKD